MERKNCIGRKGRNSIYNTLLIAHLEEENISVDELEMVLKEIFEKDINVLQNSIPAVRTNVRRLILIYDYLKWGK